ncbi:MAG: hypothetical protein M1305_04145, partial [Candidatus Marsarchaeota archaeon]|nr:hypothetical protein [Candidatus Marsarchaeota archaeon]
IAVYHANPLVFIPSDFVGDPFLQWVSWKDTQSVYGPAWLLLSTLMSYASGDNIVTHVLVFKASAIVFHLANTVLIWMILGRINPQKRVFGTLLYAWNPLVLIEFAGSGHNDAMMVFFLLLTVWSYTGGAKRLGWVWLAIAVVTKSAALIFVPAYAILLLRDHRAWRKQAIVVLEGAGIITALIALFYLPFWAGSQVVQYYLTLPPFRGYTNSMGEVAYLALQKLLAAWPKAAGPNVQEISDNLVKLGGALLFLSYFVRKTFTVKSLSGTISAWASILFFYLVVFVAWFWPWYVVWLVALVALVDDAKLWRLAILFSFSSTLAYLFTPSPVQPRLSILFDYKGLLVFAPLALLLLTETVLEIVRRRRTEMVLGNEAVVHTDGSVTLRRRQSLSER